MCNRVCCGCDDEHLKLAMQLVDADDALDEKPFDSLDALHRAHDKHIQYKDENDKKLTMPTQQMTMLCALHMARARTTNANTQRKIFAALERTFTSEQRFSLWMNSKL